MMMMSRRRRRRLYARHSFHFPSTPLSKDKSPGSCSTAFKVAFLYARTHTHTKKGVGSSPIGQKTTQNLSIRPLSLSLLRLGGGGGGGGGGPFDASKRPILKPGGVLGRPFGGVLSALSLLKARKE